MQYKPVVSPICLSQISQSRCLLCIPRRWWRLPLWEEAFHLDSPVTRLFFLGKLGSFHVPSEAATTLENAKIQSYIMRILFFLFQQERKARHSVLTWIENGSRQFSQVLPRHILPANTGEQAACVLEHFLRTRKCQ